MTNATKEAVKTKAREVAENLLATVRLRVREKVQSAEGPLRVVGVIPEVAEELMMEGALVALAALDVATAKK